MRAGVVSNPTNEYLTINQACAWLQVSRRTLYNWMNAGTVTFVRLPSGTRRIVRASVVRTVETRDGASVVTTEETTRG